MHDLDDIISYFVTIKFGCILKGKKNTLSSFCQSLLKVKFGVNWFQSLQQAACVSNR